MKRPIGLKIFTVVYFLLGCGYIFAALNCLIVFARYLQETSRPNEFSFGFGASLIVITTGKAVGYIAGAVKLFRFKRQGYRIVLFWLIVPFFIALELPLLIIHIIYFNLHKIKTQFK